MNRSITAVAIALFCVISPIRTGTLAQPAAAKDTQDFLNAPVWYLAYDVSYKVSHEGTYTTWDLRDRSTERPANFTVSLDRSFSGSAVLGTRGPGPGTLSMAAMAGSWSDGSAPTPAQQAELMRLYSRIDQMANWMLGGSSSDDYETAMDDTKAGIEASMGPARVEYTRVDKGERFTTSGSPYRFTIRTTGRAEGKVLSATTMVTLEIDAGTGRYLLCLPFVYSPETSSKGSQETVHVTEHEGQPPQEERSTNSFQLGFPRDLALDDPKGHPEGGVVLKGDIDPATGRISGEQSFKAHFSESDGTIVSGTLTFRYTLTMTPPAKQAAKGK
jgi:hypothetical protein